ncbi:MAG: STY4526/YPO1902 family pathogenicity island replication protein [Gammaproteobacteria bacterium]|nr:STY4526/YPO1902 family pathogenicity island replication protein [Gammaproteobacteria bacterium]
MNTKEGSLVSAVLMYAMRCLAEGDLRSLQHMQFGEKEVEALRDLQMRDFSRIEAMKAHCLTVSLNRQVFWPMIDLLKRERHSEDLMNELIEKNAPYNMIHELFGMSTREYAARRRHLPSNLGLGRPQLPERDIEDGLYAAWRKLVDSRGNYELSAVDFLDLHRKTGVTIRAVWSLVSKWTREESC